jgi:hypothetical protein
MVTEGATLTPLRGFALRKRTNPHGSRRGLRTFAPPGLPPWPACPYSCRSASIGSSLAALIAGNMPKMRPTAAEKPNAIAIAQSGIEA